MQKRVDPLHQSKIDSIDTYGDPNTLTMNIPTSELAQPTSAQTCLVSIEKFKGELPQSLYLSVQLK